MNKEKISDRQGVNLGILFVFGSTLVMGTAGQAKNDAWISIILSIILTIPVLLMYSRIMYRYPGENLYDILEKVMGKFIGKGFVLLYTWFFFHLGALVLRNFGEFMNTVGLPETPKIVPIIMFSLICVIGVKDGIETLGKCSSYFIILVILSIVIVGSFTIPIIKPDKILPIMANGIKPVLMGTFAAFSFPFGELVIFTTVFDSLEEAVSCSKVYLKTLLLAGAFVVLVSIRNIMVLGTDTLGAVYFPSYSAVSRINIGNFLQRLEIAVTVVFILSGFIKISICLHAATKGFAKLIGYKDYRLFATPIALLMVNLAYLVYDSIMEMFEWAQDIWPYYAFPFQVIFPLILFVAVEGKARLQKKEDSKKEEAQA